MSDLNTQLLPVLPLAAGVVLPQMVVTLTLETDEAKAAGAAAAPGRLLLLVPRVDGRYAAVGTVARIENTGELPGGQPVLVVQGLHRAVIGTGSAGTGSVLWVGAEPVDADIEPTERARELGRELRLVLEVLLEHRGGRRLTEVIAGITDPGQLADTAGYWPDLAIEQKVAVLEAVDVEQRVELVLGWARDLLADVELKERIRSEVSDGMEKQQRQFLLRQQLNAIRKELGEGGDDEDVVDEYRRRADEADLPDAVRTAVDREVGRLERMGEQSPEHGWIRTYLDTVLDIPWSVKAEDRLDVVEARRILDADHNGLDDVKDRIIELLAVRKLRSERNVEVIGGRGSGAVVTLVGPPGVGKTSLGESIARALGRPFVRVALGGIRDEAEIRGHRRTYVGAQPGRIARAIKEAGAMNPVLLLDEIDKVGNDWRGDPSSALLEVLDPAQNHTFRDHYLEIDLDLSDVVFLATANVVDSIPAPLYDRMEVVRLDGYTDDEKVAIARDHLFGRQLDRVGLRPDEVVIDDAALRRIVSEHTREAGVRSLERALGGLLRKVAVKVTGGDADVPVHVREQDVPDYLGRAKFVFEPAERTDVPGVATGLAVTGAGGDVLYVEAMSMEGEPGLVVTGQLGDVMKESAQIALSYVRSHALALGVAGDFDRRRYHVHFPAGAVPKDGPSAGITMTTALVSLLTGRPMRATVAMTGEVTLQGKVLPIGGLKQKVLAAHRAGLREVIFPARNEADLDDVPEAVRAEMTFHPVADVADAIRLALEPAPAATAEAA